MVGVAVAVGAAVVVAVVVAVGAAVVVAVAVAVGAAVVVAVGVVVGVTVHSAWLWLAVVVILMWLLVSLWTRGQVR